MARKQKVGVEIGVTGVRKTDKDLEKVETRFQRLGKGAKALKAHWFALTAGAAGVVLAFKSIISASAQQEEALKKLEVASAKYGATGGVVAEAAAKQAAALQQISKFGDEAIITQQAILIQMGVTAEKLPLATQATVDLAEAMGISLEAAARNIGKTMGGFAGELGELIPELKNLTAEQLKAGAGVDLLAAKFAGTAKNTVTFAKSMAQLGNSFGDLLEALGDSVTQSDNATSALNKLKGAIEGLIPLARRMGEVFDAIGQTVWNLALPLRLLYDASAKLTDIWLKLSGATDVVEGRLEAFQATADRTGTTVGELRAELEQARIATRDFNEDARNLADAGGEMADTFEADAIEINALVGSLQKMEEATADVTDDMGESTREVERNTVAIQAHTAAVNQDVAATNEQVAALSRASNAYREQQKTASSIGQPLFPGLSSRSAGGGGGTFVQVGGKRAQLAADGRIIFV
jgi:ABC-type transporter Mla subunit MlaD